MEDFLYRAWPKSLPEAGDWLPNLYPEPVEGLQLRKLFDSAELSSTSLRVLMFVAKFSSLQMWARKFRQTWHDHPLAYNKIRLPELP